MRWLQGSRVSMVNMDCLNFCSSCLSSQRGSHVLSSLVVHAGCVFVAGIHPSRIWMSGSFESLWWSACIYRLDWWNKKSMVLWKLYIPLSVSGIWTVHSICVYHLWIRVSLCGEATTYGFVPLCWNYCLEQCLFLVKQPHKAFFLCGEAAFYGEAAT